MKRLFDLPEDYRATDAAIAFCPADAHDQAEWHMKEGESRLTVAANYAKLAKEHKSHVAGLKDQLRQLKLQIAEEEDLVRVYESVIRTLMETMQTDTLEDPAVPVKIVRNPPSVRVYEASAVPSQLRRIIPEQRVPDLEAIKRQLIAGEAIPGCELQSSYRLKY